MTKLVGVALKGSVSTTQYSAMGQGAQTITLVKTLNRCDGSSLVSTARLKSTAIIHSKNAEGNSFQLGTTRFEKKLAFISSLDLCCFIVRLWPRKWSDVAGSKKPVNPRPLRPFMIYNVSGKSPHNLHLLIEYKLKLANRTTYGKPRWPSIIPVISLCTFSMQFTSFCRKGAKAQTQYSKCGLTTALYKRKKTSGLVQLKAHL
ncbi:unnamed protein product, partial [Dicrocoelium dendriticum]